MKLGLGICCVAAALALSACATAERFAGLKVDQRTIALAVSAFGAAEASATTYLGLAPCAQGQKATLRVPCRSAALASRLAADVRLGRAARDALWADAKANGGNGTPALSAAFSAAIATLQTDLKGTGQ